MAKGYRILAKRFRTPHGEIDLVARRRNLLVFVEVKARASLDEAAYAVTPRQQRRIIDAAQAWLMAHPEHAEFDLRFDAMLIAPRRLAAPSVSGIRRQHLKSPTKPTCGPAHETECRRPDGPHRAHQHPRRFDLCAAAGGAKARPRRCLITRPTNCRCAARNWWRRFSRSPCATRPAITSRSASRRREPLAAFDVVLLRQDPPFDLAYITSTHLLERIHPEDAGRERSRPACATRRKRSS